MSFDWRNVRCITVGDGALASKVRPVSKTNKLMSGSNSKARCVRFKFGLHNKKHPSGAFIFSNFSIILNYL